MRLVKSSWAAVALLLVSVGARAEYITVDLSGVANSELATYTNGYGYPAPGVQMVGGIPFDFAAAPGGTAAVVGGLASIGEPANYSVWVDLSGITSVFAIVNSAFGSCGSTVGSLNFHAGSSTQSFTLTEGVNVRDHYQGGFCNAQTDAVYTAEYGNGIIYDVYRYDVSGLTAGGSINLDFFWFSTYGAGGAGEPLLAGITFERTVPEPGTLALMLTGAGLLAFARRRKRIAA